MGELLRHNIAIEFYLKLNKFLYYVMPCHPSLYVHVWKIKKRSKRWDWKRERWMLFLKVTFVTKPPSFTTGQFHIYASDSYTSWVTHTFHFKSFLIKLQALAMLKKKIPESAYIDRFISIKKKSRPIKRKHIAGQNWMMKKIIEMCEL